jgi:DNA replication and repair protein RecF
VAEQFTELCRAIGERASVRVRYASSLGGSDEPPESLGAALVKQRASDIRRGLTQAGPHRDDLVITIDDDAGVERELRVFGSAGQQRTAAIAIRMLEAATLSRASGRAPLFLLDDPFAELDARRAASVLELLAKHGLGQTILAVPRESDIPGEFTGLSRFRVIEGRVLAPAHGRGGAT